MIQKHLKNNLKKFNYYSGNILNKAPRVLTEKEIQYIKKKKIEKLINLNLFYKNQKFNIFFWKFIFSYLNNENVNDLNFFNHIKKNIKKKNILELITIYNIFLVIGKFILALKIRKYFLLNFSKLNFFLNSNYLNKIKKIDNSIQTHNVKKLKINKREINFEILKNKIKNNLDYKAFLKDKKIALYGVGVSTQKNFKESKNFDIIIKFNYYSRLQLKNLSHCQISYYSDYFLESKKKLIEYNLGIRFMMIKKKINISRFKSYKIRNCNTYEDLFFGTPSLLLNTILDVVKYKPKKLKIYNSTLYFPINKKNFDPLQKKYDSFQKFGYVKSFGTHDIISEYLILRNLYFLKYIDVDSNLKKILTIGLEKYLKKMETFHKKPVIEFLQTI